MLSKCFLWRATLPAPGRRYTETKGTSIPIPSLRNNILVIRCCYLGMFIQAMVINLAPLLFIPFRTEFGLSYEQMGRLVLVNFLTQMVVDLLCVVFARRMHVKTLVAGANLLAGVGLWLFALAPGWFAVPYHGLLLGTVVLSVGCGLLEVLLSPIIDALPSRAVRKAVSDMALLHAFYPIGKVTVIVLTALALNALGTANWRGIVLAWSVFPFLNTFGFLLVQPPPLAPEGSQTGLRTLLAHPAFGQLLVVIALAGATELTIAQWASAYLEKGLGLSKLVADLVGFCLFAAGMIAGRLWIGMKGEAVDLRRVMIGSSLLSALMCLVMTLSPSPAVALAACAPAGGFVAMLWPGSVSLSAARFPAGGAAMFALLAAAGDGGAALAPWGVGRMADDPRAFRWLLPVFGDSLSAEQLGLRAGLLVTALCPLALAAVLRFWRPKGSSDSSPSPTIAGDGSGAP